MGSYFMFHGHKVGILYAILSASKKAFKHA